MYHHIVKQIIRDGFQRLSQGDYEPIVAKFAERTHFKFVGDHAMGASLRTVPAIRQWFQRTLRLFPGIQFEVRDVSVSGMPWDTLVVTQLGIRATLCDGGTYQNSALQVVRLQWGRIIEDMVWEDTHVLVAALKNLAQQGIQEATAMPIADGAA